VLASLSLATDPHQAPETEWVAETDEQVPALVLNRLWTFSGQVLVLVGVAFCQTLNRREWEEAEPGVGLEIPRCRKKAWNLDEQEMGAEEMHVTYGVEELESDQIGMARLHSRHHPGCCDITCAIRSGLIERKMSTVQVRWRLMIATLPAQLCLVALSSCKLLTMLENQSLGKTAPQLAVNLRILSEEPAKVKLTDIEGPTVLVSHSHCEDSMRYFESCSNLQCPVEQNGSPELFRYPQCCCQD
jgi:hypothetical protein